MAAALLAGGSAIMAQADPAGTQALAMTRDVTTYTLKAQPIDLEGMPGVYRVAASVGDTGGGSNPTTIGIPSVAKQNLVLPENGPTKEMPAIIRGAAVNYEKRTGPVDFKPFSPGTERVAPYSYFPHAVINEKRKDADGKTSVHKKLSGFDGSYYIIRVDVSQIIEDAKAKAKGGKLDGKYLHVKQESNIALMASYGIEGSTFSDATGNKTASYSLANDAAALKDKGSGDQDKTTPYFDVIVLSSGKVVAGADEGKKDAPSADIKLTFYVDGQKQYNKMKALDPLKLPTFPYTVGKVKYKTEADYNKAVLGRFFKDSRATAANSTTGYLVKGSDLEIDAAVDKSNDWESTVREDGSYRGIDWQRENADFWSMTEAIAHQDYDEHTIKLICEVPVLTSLCIEGDTDRSVILDVNSFDIQIANNNEGTAPGLTIKRNAQLRIMDSSQTSGAELAIGNDATMLIEKGGVMIIDETCSGEVEYDAATTTSPSTTPGNLHSGEITIKDGGRIINRGVLNIEGKEKKPVEAEGQTATQTDMQNSDIVIEYGGVMDNYGCLSIKGVLYVMGTLNNYSRYAGTITAYDPDKGKIVYHKGIQVTWKDDVTRKGATPGILFVGVGPTGPDGNAPTEPRAVLNNYGDIVLAPGTFNLYGTLNNTKDPARPDRDYAGHLYICTAREAVVPITPTTKDPTKLEKRVKLKHPRESVWFPKHGNIVNEGKGLIASAAVTIVSNGVLGELITMEQAEAKFSADVAKAAKSRTKIVRAKAGKGRAKITWRKVKGTTGYQCKYSLKKSFKKKVKTKAVKGASKKKLVLKNLRKGKVYYVKVRPYKVVQNPVTGKTKKVFGKWSAVKRVKVRK